MSWLSASKKPAATSKTEKYLETEQEQTRSRVMAKDSRTRQHTSRRTSEKQNQVPKLNATKASRTSKPATDSKKEKGNNSEQGKIVKKYTKRPIRK